MDLSVLPKDEIWFLHVCHHISAGFLSLGHKLGMLTQGPSCILFLDLQYFIFKQTLFVGQLVCIQKEKFIN